MTIGRSGKKRRKVFLGQSDEVKGVRTASFHCPLLSSWDIELVRLEAVSIKRALCLRLAPIVCGIGQVKGKIPG